MDLERLIDDYRGPLLGLLRSWGAPPRDARELAEDSFAEAYVGRERFRGDWERPADAGPWLRGIAFRLFQSWRRKRERAAGDAPAEELPAVSDEAAEAAQDRGAALRSAVERLPDELRTVIWMHYIEQTAVREVAGLLGVTEKTVEGRLYRARKELKRMLDGEAAASTDRGALR